MGEEQAPVDGRIERALDFLRARITVSAAVVFGSYVTTAGRHFNDIDLAVFSPQVATMSLSDRGRLYAEMVLDCDRQVELHLFPASALQEARPTNFVGHILATGRRVA